MDAAEQREPDEARASRPVLFSVVGVFAIGGSQLHRDHFERKARGRLGLYG